MKRHNEAIFFLFCLIFVFVRPTDCLLNQALPKIVGGAAGDTTMTAFDMHTEGQHAVIAGYSRATDIHSFKDDGGVLIPEFSFIQLFDAGYTSRTGN